MPEISQAGQSGELQTVVPPQGPPVVAAPEPAASTDVRPHACSPLSHALTLRYCASYAMRANCSIILRVSRLQVPMALHPMGGAYAAFISFAELHGTGPYSLRDLQVAASLLGLPSNGPTPGATASCSARHREAHGVKCETLIFLVLNSNVCSDSALLGCLLDELLARF